MGYDIGYYKPIGLYWVIINLGVYIFILSGYLKQKPVMLGFLFFIFN